MTHRTVRLYSDRIGRMIPPGGIVKTTPVEAEGYAVRTTIDED